MLLIPVPKERSVAWHVNVRMLQFMQAVAFNWRI
ncbi:hypothetical protein ABIE78_003649 [Sinorhizobium fredii]